MPQRRKNSRSKRSQIPSIEKQEIPGITVSQDGNETSIGFDTQSLSASEHFFRANCYCMKLEGGEFLILFAHRSSFFNSKELTAAAEISFPLKQATDFLYNRIWNSSSLPSTSLIKNIDKHTASSNHLNEESLEKGNLVLNEELQPPDRSTYRAFPANIAIPSFAEGQGMLEFFEISPDLVANLARGRNLRRNDGLKHVLAIILPIDVLRSFFYEAKKLLEPHFIEK